MKPTAEQLSKLPKWAQEHIQNVERQRVVAVRALDEYVDSQTPSSFYTEDLECTTDGGPTMRRRYIHGHQISIDHAGVHLDIHLARKDDGQREFGIELQYGATEGSLGFSPIAIVPHSVNAIQLVHKENMQ